MLSPEYSAEPGKYSTARTPYAKEILNCMNDDGLEEIVLVTGTQLGKSTIIENCIAYLVVNSPAPMLLVLPNYKSVESCSKDRLAPLIRDTEILRDRFADEKKHSSESTIKIKKFDGGQLTLVGSNSPADLASRSIKYLFLDEVDKYGKNGKANKEGDVVSLAYKRTSNFLDAKKIATSSPTVRNESKIEAMYLETDRRKFHVPCPHCHKKQIIKFSFDEKLDTPHACMKWLKSEDGEALTDTAYLECYFCKRDIQERYKQEMLTNGEWIAERPTINKAGFWISGLYSPWRSWQSIVSEFLSVTQSRDKELLKTFANTVLAETWREENEVTEKEALISRTEDYDPNIALPEGIKVLTASVDVQEFALVVEIQGWGIGRERWGIERKFLLGNTKLQATWKQLEDFLWEGYPKNSPKKLIPKMVCIDSGYNTLDVKNFCKKFASRNVYAIKGRPGKHPIVGRAKKGFGSGVIMVGVDECKERIILNSLKLTEPGPEYYHFPKNNGYDSDYFKELTSEERCTKFSNGYVIKYWKKISQRQANEALDLAVYGLAALTLLNVNWKAFEKPIGIRPEETKPIELPRQIVQQPRQPISRPYRHNWVTEGRE